MGLALHFMTGRRFSTTATYSLVALAGLSSIIAGFQVGFPADYFQYALVTGMIKLFLFIESIIVIGLVFGSQTPHLSFLFDSTGKPVTGKLQVMMAYVTPAWRYLFGTFVVRSTTVSATYGDGVLAAATYSQSQVQSLIDQVAALSKVVGQ